MGSGLSASGNRADGESSSSKSGRFSFKTPSFFMNLTSFRMLFRFSSIYRCGNVLSEMEFIVVMIATIISIVVLSLTTQATDGMKACKDMCPTGVKYYDHEKRNCFCLTGETDIKK